MLEFIIRLYKSVYDRMSVRLDTNSGSRLRGVNLVYPSELWNKCCIGDVEHH